MTPPRSRSKTRAAYKIIAVSLYRNEIILLDRLMRQLGKRLGNDSF